MNFNDIDVAQIMADITAEAEKRYGEIEKKEHAENKETSIAELPCGELNLGIKSRNHRIHISLPTVRACNGIQFRIPGYENRGSVMRRICRLIARIVLKLSRFITVQQNDVNNTLGDSVELLQTSVLTLGDWSEQIERNFNVLNAKIASLEHELGRKVYTEADNTNIYNKFYTEFEEQHRGSKEDIRKRLQYYIDGYVLPNINAEDGGMILDIGCGRGEWLELLAEYGYKGIGVDLNAEAIGQCHNKEIKMYCVDGIGYLKTLPSNSVKLLTSFQVVEHLKMHQLIELFQEIERVMRKDGLIIMETPNPCNINVGANSFYMDPTHQRPVPSELLKFMAEEYGMSETEITYWQKGQIEEWWNSVWEKDETEIGKSSQYRAMLEEFRHHIWCSADYALIAKK